MSGTVWTKFYWSDWLSEPKLRICSYAARGLWMDMLCIAAAHDPIGYVAVAGLGLDETAIARMTGGPESEVRDLLGELGRNGVFSRDRQGRIYSRRMLADAKKAAIAKKNGKFGGNPTLGKYGANSPSDNPPVKAGVKPHKPSATLTGDRSEAKASSSPGGDAVREAFENWNDLARRLSLPVAKTLDKARRASIAARLGEGGPGSWTEALKGVEASAHCRGENDRGWRADIDFVASPKGFRRLREGAYGKGAPAQATGPAPTFPGPDRVRSAILTAWPEADAILKFCGWNEEQSAILVPTAGYTKKLAEEAAPAFAPRSFTLRHERPEA